MNMFTVDNFQLSQQVGEHKVSYTGAQNLNQVHNTNDPALLDFGKTGIDEIIKSDKLSTKFDIKSSLNEIGVLAKEKSKKEQQLESEHQVSLSYQTTIVYRNSVGRFLADPLPVQQQNYTFRLLPIEAVRRINIGYTDKLKLLPKFSESKLLVLRKNYLFAKMPLTLTYYPTGPHPMLAYLRRWFSRYIGSKVLDSNGVATARVYEIGTNPIYIWADRTVFVGGIYGYLDEADAQRRTNIRIAMTNPNNIPWLFLGLEANEHTYPHTLDVHPCGNHTGIALYPQGTTLMQKATTPPIPNLALVPHIASLIDTVYYPGVIEHVVANLTRGIYLAVYGTLWIYKDNTSGTYYQDQGTWSCNNGNVVSMPEGNQFAYKHRNTFPELLNNGAWGYTTTVNGTTRRFTVTVIDRISGAGADYVHFNLFLTAHDFTQSDVAETKPLKTVLLKDPKDWTVGTDFSIAYSKEAAVYHISNKRMYIIKNYYPASDPSEKSVIFYEQRSMFMKLSTEDFLIQLSQINSNLKNVKDPESLSEKINSMAISFAVTQSMNLEDAANVLTTMYFYNKMNTMAVRTNMAQQPVPSYDQVRHIIMDDKMAVKFIVFLAALAILLSVTIVHFFVDTHFRKLCVATTIAIFIAILSHNKSCTELIIGMFDTFLPVEYRNAAAYIATIIGCYFSPHVSAPYMIWGIYVLVTNGNRHLIILEWFNHYKRPILILIAGMVFLPFINTFATVAEHPMRNLSNFVYTSVGGEYTPEVLETVQRYDVFSIILVATAAILIVIGIMKEILIFAPAAVILTYYIVKFVTITYTPNVFVNARNSLTEHMDSTLPLLIAGYVFFKLLRLCIKKQNLFPVDTRIIQKRVDKIYYKTCIDKKYFDQNDFDVEPGQIEMTKKYKKYSTLMDGTKNKEMVYRQIDFHSQKFCTEISKIACTQVMPKIKMEAEPNLQNYHTCQYTVLTAAKRQAKKCVKPNKIEFGLFKEWFEKHMQPRIDEMFIKHQVHYDYANWYNHLKQIQRIRIQQFHLDNPVINASNIIELARLYTAFPKGELQWEDKNKTRCIVNPSELRKEVTGPIIYDLERLLKLFFPQYMSGKNYTTRGYTLAEIATRLGEDCINLMLDGKDFDITQHIWLKMCDDALYKTYFKHVDITQVRYPDHALKMLLDHKAVIKVEDPLKHGRTMMTITHSGRVHSGDMETTLGNSFRMICYMEYVAYVAGIPSDKYALQVAGDDNAMFVQRAYYHYNETKILSAYSRIFATANYKGSNHGLGQIAKYLKKGTIDTGDFCTTNCIPTTRNGELYYRLIRVPLRAFRSMWAMSPTTLTKEQWMDAIAQCGLAWAQGIPIMGKLYERIVELIGDVPLAKQINFKIKCPDLEGAIPFPETFQQHVELPEQLKYKALTLDQKQVYKSFERYVVNQPQDYQNAADWMERVYGITKEDIVDTEQLISKLELEDEIWDLPVFNKFEKSLPYIDLVNQL